VKCRECGREFDPKKKSRGGYIYQCDNCATEKVDKYVGRVGEKCITFEIFRENIPYWKSHLERESRVGFSPNLPVNNPVSIQNWEAMKSE